MNPTSLLAALTALADGASLPIDPAWMPVAIFGLRCFSVTLGTLRMLASVRGRKMIAWVTGFFQALVFVTAVSGVLSHLDNLWNIIAFAVGLATGNVLGISLEEKLAPGHSLMRIYSPGLGEAIAKALRQQNQGATILPAQGKDGTVSLIMSYVPRHRTAEIKRQIVSQDPQAFVSIEHVRQLRGGWGT